MTNFEIHQQEQEEAMKQQAFKTFMDTMRKLNADHETAKKRIQRDSVILFWSIGFFAAAMLIAPFVPILIQYLQNESLDAIFLFPIFVACALLLAVGLTGFKK